MSIPEAATLALLAIPPGSPGAALGLRPGDVLVALDGVAFAGDEAALAARLAQGPAALTFQRAGAEFTLLARRPDLGRWQAVPATASPAAVSPPARQPIDPARLSEWEVWRDGEGRYDMLPLHLPALALICPQLWLAQMRLWQWLALLLAAPMAGWLAHPLLALAVQAAASLHLRGAYLAYLRADRAQRGLAFCGVLAARTEAAAHATQQALQAGDRFLFGRTAPLGPMAGAAQE